ncbi:MAG: hypothetical protein JKY56_22920, partial [Kofleriaceae bacterium]|nr:hypothetical protein [Kofleriaceae bacterium]
RVWVADVPKGDWGPFIRGERSLQPEDMELQTLNDMVWGVHPDAPL